jgi:hypothetical protein
MVLAGFGAVGVWFSHPLALVLAGVGTYLMAVAALSKQWGKMRDLLAMNLVWALSFAACYVVSHRILSQDQFIWDWWDFAFLRLPPRSLLDLKRDSWAIVNVFNSPAGVLTPLGVLPSAFLALGLFLVGGLAMRKRWPGGLYLLLAPVFFALGASAMRQYPFHGRLLIFLVSSIYLLIGEGVAELGRRGGRLLTVAVAALLLSQPAFEAVWYHFISVRTHVGWDTHGDLRNDLLDYLENLENKSSNSRSRP